MIGMDEPGFIRLWTKWFGGQREPLPSSSVMYWNPLRRPLQRNLQENLLVFAEKPWAGLRGAPPRRVRTWVIRYGLMPAGRRTYAGCALGRRVTLVMCSAFSHALFQE